MITAQHGIVKPSPGNLALLGALQLNGVDQNLKVPITSCRAVSFWINTAAMTTNHYLLDARAGGDALVIKSTSVGTSKISYNDVDSTSSSPESGLLNTWARVYVEFVNPQTATLRISSRFTDVEFVQRRIADLRTYSAPLTIQERQDLKLNSRAFAASIQSHFLLEDDLNDTLKGLVATVPGTATFVPY
ncbi:hypothetical protein GU926_08245 [Nibribacter ruber]|uniref:Uncharacterized protein n=1 Tax=Nibribacter ruber TaxID=2698458 RepID=A0A6P1NU81_9BACT|nr:hypothetical protein [Nibribacter ruber]QHL87426.1 hypothetical protein GU926_08245 [Nibribacter ruber]